MAKRAAAVAFARVALVLGSAYEDDWSVHVYINNTVGIHLRVEASDGAPVDVAPYSMTRHRARLGDLLRVSYAYNGDFLRFVNAAPVHIVPAAGCNAQPSPCPPRRMFQASDRWTDADFAVFQNDALFEVVLYYVNDDEHCEERVVHSPLPTRGQVHLHTTLGHVLRARRVLDDACVWQGRVEAFDVTVDEF